jgi:hypothetical protein
MKLATLKRAINSIPDDCELSVRRTVLCATIFEHEYKVESIEISPSEVLLKLVPAQCRGDSDCGCDSR